MANSRGAVPGPKAKPRMAGQFGGGDQRQNRQSQHDAAVEVRGTRTG